MKKIVFALLLLPALIQAQSEVGINTTHPMFDLDIHGVYNDTLVQAASILQLTDTSQLNFLRLYSGRGNDPKPFIAFSNSDTFSLVSTSPDWMQFERVMSIVPNGNMGIRTVSPEFDIDVRGMDNDWDGGELQLATPDETNFLRFFGGRQGDKNPFIAFHETDTFHLVTTSTDWTTFQRRMSMDPNGNVGIGIEGPTAKLEVVGNSTIAYPQLKISEEGDDYARMKFVNTAHPSTFWDLAAQTDTLQTGARVNFFYSGPEGSGDRLTIRGDGNVGIGTTVPEAQLDVKGGDWNLDAGNPGDLRIGNPTHNFRLGIATGGGGAGLTRMYSSNALFLGTADQTHLAILSGGNIGIGTTNPATKLEVNGDVRISTLSGTGNRNLIVDGNGTMKIGTVGVGDTDWTETATQVLSTKQVYVDATNPPNSSMTIEGRTSNGDNFSALAIYNNTQFPGGTFDRMLIDANNIDAFRGTGVTPIDVDLYLQQLSSANLRLVDGGGKVGIGVSPTSRLTVRGAESAGVDGPLEVQSFGSSWKLLIDNNEIDAVGTGTRLMLNANSNNPVSIGTTAAASGYALSVGGKVMAEEVRVQLQSNWPDYVFDAQYSLPDLHTIEAVIRDEGHLPGIPAAAELEANGIELGEMQRLMMEKIEELTLHIIALNKRIETLESENQE